MKTQKTLRIIITILIISFAINRSTGQIIAHWDFNEQSGNILNDISGNGHDGTISDAVWGDGYLCFDGENSQVEVPYSPEFSGLTNLTVEATFKVTSLPDISDYARIIAVYDQFNGFNSSTQQAFALSIVNESNGVRLSFGVRTGSSTVYDGTGVNYTFTDFPMDQWIKVTAIAENGYYYLYLNDEFLALNDIYSSAIIKEANTPLTIGYSIGTNNDNDPVDTHFEGCIDDIRIFSCDEIPPFVDLGEDIEICEGENVILDAGNPGCDYLWSNGETTQTITVTETGTYSVTVSNTCDSDSDIINVTVSPLPNADAGENQTIYIGYPLESAQLFATGGVEYYWEPSTGLSDPNIQNPIATPAESTTYTVFVTDENGCSGSAQVNIEVIDVRCGNNLDKILVCKVPPGNPENKHNICVAKDAVPALLEQGSYLGPCNFDKSDEIFEELKNNNTNFNASVYPIPITRDITINIQLPYTSQINVEIFSLDGRDVYEKDLGTFNKGKHDLYLNLSDVFKKNQLTNIYLLKIRTNKEYQIIKLVCSPDR